MAEAMASGYAAVNGLTMYYEVEGAGRPLVLIPGGFGLTCTFAALRPALAELGQVISVELPGHGHTPDRDQVFSYEQFADDIAALIRELGLGPAAVLGYSVGGGVALQTALRHPDAVRRLIVLSAPHQRRGWYPEVLAGMGQLTAERLQATPLYDRYTAVAPDPAHWPRLVDKTRILLSQDYDWSEPVRGITAPTLLIYGDADSISPASAAELFALLGGGQGDGDRHGLPRAQLALLPGVTHQQILHRTDLLLPVLRPFLTAGNQ